LAWLIAYNERLLDDVPPDDLQRVLHRLEQRVDASDLTLDSPRDRWREKIPLWKRFP